MIVVHGESDGSLAVRLARRPDRGVLLTWLGQAGFALRTADVGLALVDPYLSDSLADKYRGTARPHHRMVPVPIDPAALPPTDLVLCTHRHTDHMDPGTLGPLLSTQPTCRVVAPAAEAEVAQARGVPGPRLIRVDAGDDVRPATGMRLRVLASAHEELITDDAGRQRHLGYVIDAGGVRMYHSGDCIPYPGLAEALRGLAVDVALLPVNGRDADRLAAGVPGNFWFGEAVDLCVAARIPTLVPHHHGMFDDNTVDPASFDTLDAADRGVEVVVPVLGADLTIRPGDHGEEDA